MTPSMAQPTSPPTPAIPTSHSPYMHASVMVPSDDNSEPQSQPIQNKAENSVGTAVLSSLQNLPAVTAAYQFVTTVQGHSIEHNPSAESITIDGIAILKDGDTTQLAGTPVALQPNGDLAIGSSTISAFLSDFGSESAFAAPETGVATIAGQVLTVLPGGIAVGGMTLAPNGPGFKIAGTAISLGAKGLIIGTSTLSIRIVTPTPIAIADSLSLYSLADGKTVIDSDTLKPDALLSGAAVTQDAPDTTADVTMGLLNDGRVVIEGTTIAPGGAAVSIGGKLVSLGAGELVIGSSAIDLSAQSMRGAGISIGGHNVPIVPILNGVSVGETAILEVQPAKTIYGTPISLGDTGLVVGTSTIPLPTDKFDLLSEVTIDNHVVSLSRFDDGVVINRTSLRCGSAIILSGTRIALETSGLIVGMPQSTPYPNIAQPTMSDATDGSVSNAVALVLVAPTATDIGSAQQVSNANATTSSVDAEALLGAANRISNLPKGTLMAAMFVYLVLHDKF